MRTSLRKRLHCERLEDRRLLAVVGTVDDLSDQPIASGEPAGENLLAAVSGVVFHDVNGDGQRGPREPGLPGVVVYSDLNGNGVLDNHEPRTETRGDRLSTPENEAGHYTLGDLPAGLHVIRQVVPEGMEQTYPQTAFPEIAPPLPIPLPPDAHVVLLHDGQVVEGFDFGNREVRPGSVSGIKWHDLDGDGQRDENEPGLAGVTVYADLDRDGHYDRNEPWAITAEDDPDTNVDETGHYRLAGLAPGEYLIREVVPDGYEQTFPRNNSGQPNDPDSGAVDPATQEAVTVAPESLQIELADGEVFHTTLEVTVHVNFIQPIEINAVASSPDVGFQNLSGIQINGGGGAVSQFEIAITGDGEPDRFEILIVDADPAVFAPPLARVDVSVNSPRDQGGAHRVVVESGQTVERVNFGNRRIRPGSVHGIKWEDRNGNGEHDGDEPGLAGVVIYSDLNRNGEFDEGEPATRTLEDDPHTRFDETGMYWLRGLDAGRHVIREVVPEGYMQTFPEPLLLPVPHDSANPDGTLPGLPYSVPGAHEVIVESGQAVDGVDFGNQQIIVGAVEGLKWQDLDGDGVRDPNEPGLAGVVIYSDLNFNGVLDDGEPHTKTIDDPREFFPNDTGKYWLDGLRPGFHVIREVVPDGFRQTFPGDVVIAGDDPAISIYPPIGGVHFVFLGSGQTLSDLDFGNQPLRSGTVAGYKWVDLNGDRQRSEDEPGLAGVTIYADLNFNDVLDDNEPHTVTEEDNPETNVNELGRYRLSLPAGHYSIREVVPAGYNQTFPVSPSLAPFPWNGDGWHSVTVEPGQVIDDLDFGNQPAEPGAATGIKWNDLNGDGVRQDDEPGLAGVTIYSDINRNRRLDEGEPRTVSRDDDPTTERDETGTYLLEGLRQTVHYIREVVPEGYGQTFPPDPAADENGPFHNGYHVVVIHSPGLVVEGIDFGNREADPAGVSGRKWVDRNGNGQRDGEPGLGGVTIYSDLNRNGMFDSGEPHTVTSEDIPETDFDEAGLYSLGDLQPGLHWIREVVPPGSIQTYPTSLLAVIGADSHFVQLTPNEHRDGLDFGNRPLDGVPTLPGDFNRDGAVDDMDHQMWRHSFGSTTNLMADANGDGVVNSADYIVWRNNQGKTAALAEPETTSPPVEISSRLDDSPRTAAGAADSVASEPGVAQGDRLSIPPLSRNERSDARRASRIDQRESVIAQNSAVAQRDPGAQLGRLDRLRELWRSARPDREAAFELLADDADTDQSSEIATELASPFASR